MHNKKRLLALAIAAAVAAPTTALATNGMNLEGYGPIATGMGGASMAYDNGTAAMMNNPATLGLMDDGSRLDVAVGILSPDVSASKSNSSAGSSADSFMMPALGYASRSGDMTWGIGMFAQGGMGAEYAAGSSVDQSANGIPFFNPAMGNNGDYSGHKQRSELGVGRLIVPLAFNISDELTLGASLDYVWGGLDILWSMDANNFFGGLDAATYGPAMAAYGVTPENNRSVISGSLVNTFLGAFITPANMGAGTPANGDMVGFYWGHFDFSDSSDMTQAATGAGFAGKLGLTYKPSKNLTIGATYHAKTAMSDFEGDITMTWNADFYSYGADNTLGTADDQVLNQSIPVTGTVAVKDFQWPTTLGVGVAYQVSDDLMIAADWKQLKWSEVMDEFHMVIDADNSAQNQATGFANTQLDFKYR